MSELLIERIRRKNPAGIPYEEAVQLFLMLYCTTSPLPAKLKGETLSRETLEDTFEELEREGLVLRAEGSAFRGRSRRLGGLIDEMLSDPNVLDPTFSGRANRYI